MISLTWDEYKAEIAARDADAATRRTAPLAPRLEVLQHCRAWFASVKSFIHLDAPERMAIAGTLRAKADKSYILSKYRTDVDFSIFGNMAGSGTFARYVREKRSALALSNALDLIPRSGDVTQRHYNEFIARFCETLDFESPVATSSRLLAMKRPDVFVCQTSGNSAGLAAKLGYNPGELTVETYWDVIVKKIHSSPWYKAPEPQDEADRALWSGRAALLDLVCAEFRD